MTDPGTYGRRWAPIYDRAHAHLSEDAQAAAGFLAELAGGGRALELGIGTGRVALPLAERGVEVHGIDASPEMVELLRNKPGGAGIPICIGDFATVPVEGVFDLIYVVFNTFYALTHQEQQVECFQAAAEHLVPGGRFVLEGFVPDPSLFRDGGRVQAMRVSEDEAAVDIARHDRASQQVVSQLVSLKEGRIELRPVHIRYAYPSELDLMARLAGLSLAQRWADWDRRRFTGTSGKHISVYVKP